MKKLLFIFLSICIFISINMQAQNYKLFNKNSILSYTDTSAGYVPSIAFDSVKSVGLDSVYYLYRFVGYENVPATICGYLGSPYCYALDAPGYMGSKIICDNNNKYTFISASDSLVFDFGISIGDSSMFYSDPLRSFYITYEGKDTISKMGVIDSAKFYRITHIDTALNPALHNEKIIIGKNLGLIRFIKFGTFPNPPHILNIIADSKYELGIYQITAEMVYDFHVGDVFQYYDFYVMPNGPPYNNYYRYETFEYLSRTETTDSLYYTIKLTKFDQGSTVQNVSTIYRSYYKHDTLFAAPYDKLKKTSPLYYNMLYKENYWGKESWTNLNEESCFGYCATDNCWENICPGPPIYKKKKHAIGLGLVDSLEYFVHMQTGYTRRYSLIYFSIYGNNYGNQVTLGLEEKTLNNYFEIYPNPTKDLIYITKKTEESAELYIYDLQGKTLISEALSDKISEINIQEFPTGLYLIKIVSENTSFIEKIIKQ